MACKGCGKNTGDAVKEPQAEDTDPRPVINAAAVRRHAIELLSGSEFSAGMSRNPSPTELIDVLCASLVACREEAKALQMALDEGADCSAIQDELDEAEKEIEDLKKQLDLQNEVHQGEYSEVLADGHPIQTSVPAKPLSQSVSAPRQPVRQEEVRPSTAGRHVQRVHAQHDARVQFGRPR